MSTNSKGPLKLVEALRFLEGSRRSGARLLRVALACGFTPLHLKTFLHAHCLARCADREVRVEEGWFGDLPGYLERLAADPPDVCAVIVEWPDLDPRLSLRSNGSWEPAALIDIAETARASAVRIRNAIARIAPATRVVLTLPGLPLPPVSFSSPLCLSPFETELQEAVASLAACCRHAPAVSVVNPQWLNANWPARFDVTSELAHGFPYTREYASALAEVITRIAVAGAPKKGLITDLDDTLWKGILGEAGIDGIAWDLASHSQIHAVYQRLLQSLAASGVLIAVASKNDPALVESALSRPDLLVPPSVFLPG